MASIIKKEFGDNVYGFMSKYVPTAPNTYVHTVPHPLRELYEGSKNGRQPQELSKIAERLPMHIQSHLHKEIFERSNDPLKQQQWEYGKYHLFDDLPRLAEMIKEYAYSIFNPLSTDEKGNVYQEIYNIKKPRNSEFDWAEKQAKGNPATLIDGLQLRKHLPYGKEIYINEEFENSLKEHSFSFHLEKNEPPRGRIIYVNGTGCTLGGAQWDALRLSDKYARGVNVHGVFCASNGETQDMLGALLGEARISTAPVRIVIESLRNFFLSCPSYEDKCLLVCHSGGAIHVGNALEHLPEEMRKRVIVVAIAPARIISKDLCHRVVNCIIPTDDTIDPINRSPLLPQLSEVQLLAPPSNGENPHDPYNTSYAATLSKWCGSYIDHNDII